MLQGIHTKEKANKACSLYCQWISVESATGMHLVAVWIDSEMRAFTDNNSNPAENHANACMDEGVEEVEHGNAE